MRSRPRISKKYNCIYCEKKFFELPSLRNHLFDHIEIDKSNRDSWFNSISLLEKYNSKQVVKGEKIKFQKRLKKEFANAFLSSKINYLSSNELIKNIVLNVLNEFGSSKNEITKISSIKSNEQLYRLLKLKYKFNASNILPPIVKKNKKYEPSKIIKLSKINFNLFKSAKIKELVSEEKPDFIFIEEVKKCLDYKYLRRAMQNNMGRNIKETSPRKSPFISTPMGGQPGFKRK